jgi:phosphoribosylformylglycinamidine synthase subunit PurS
MKFIAEIDVMPLKELLDPQGKAVLAGFRNLHLTGIQNARIGKHITLEVEATDKTTAEEIVEEACKKLLANPVMEYFNYTVRVA